MKLSESTTIQDLRKGDIVWVKFVVDEPPTAGGDVLCRYLPRPGVNEHARRSINDVFLRPDMWNWWRRLRHSVTVKLFCRAFGWHRIDRFSLTYDGGQSYARCATCGFNGMIDSQGNLF